MTRQGPFGRKLRQTMLTRPISLCVLPSSPAWKAGFAVASCALWLVTFGAPAAAQPNIVFILADDLGVKDLSIEGSTYYETPHIDRIAKEGMRFTHGYATCQVCSPSRASIMTGKYPARHGITDWIGAATGMAWKRNNKVLPSEYVRHLPHEDVSLAEALKEGGYRTFFAGKWHLGGEGSFPEDHGFEINIWRTPPREPARRILLALHQSQDDERPARGVPSHPSREGDRRLHREADPRSRQPAGEAGPLLRLPLLLLRARPDPDHRGPLAEVPGRRPGRTPTRDRASSSTAPCRCARCRTARSTPA